jgi:hypothetical protein
MLTQKIFFNLSPIYPSEAEVNKDCHHGAICQVASDILRKPNTEAIIRGDFTHRLQTIRQRIEKKQATLLKIEQEHENALQVAQNALLQAENEHQNVKHIQQNQENIQQQMLMVSNDLEKAHEKAALLKQKQIDILQNVKLIRKILGNSFSIFTLLSQRLDTLFLRVFRIQLNHEEMNQQLNGLSEQSQMIQIDQARLGIRLNTLSQLNSSLSNEAWIIHAKMFNHPIVKETIQRLVGDSPILHLTEELAISSFSEKFKKEWNTIKSGGGSVTSYLWVNLTHLASQPISWIALAALKVSQLKGKGMPTLMQWAWTYVVNNTSPITWIALGVFASFIVKSLVSNYPFVSLVVGGCLFLVYMNYNNFSF